MSLPAPNPWLTCSLPCFAMSIPSKPSGLDDMDSPLTHIPCLFRKSPINSQKFFLYSISDFGCCSIVTCGPHSSYQDLRSGFLSPLSTYKSLSQISTRHQDETELTISSQCCRQNTNLLCVAFKSLHTLVPPGLRTSEVTHSFHVSVPLFCCPFWQVLQALLDLIII